MKSDALRDRLRRVHGWLLPDDPELGWTPYLWLTYFVFFYLFYLVVPPSAGEAVLAALGGLAFLALYFLAFHSRGGVYLGCIAGITAVGVVLSPSNPLGGTFFIYACAFASQLSSRRQVWAVVAVVLVVAVGEWLVLGLSGWFLLPVLVFAPMITLINRFQVERAEQRKDLRLSHEEVRRLAATAERERIARDLHDLLGHTLSLITLKAELAGKLLDRDARGAAREIKELERISREALREVREAITGFRAADLATELANARLALEAARIALVCDPPPTLPADLDHALAMGLREAVTNVIRHSGARTCRVRFSEVNGHTVLSVTDDGNGGLDPAGGGIRGIRERLEAAGGSLEIVEQQGVALRLTVPGPATAAPATEDAA